VSLCGISKTTVKDRELLSLLSMAKKGKLRLSEIRKEKVRTGIITRVT